MDYVVIATTGNATDFGDLNTMVVHNKPGGCASATRGIWFPGYDQSASSNNILYNNYHHRVV